MKILKWILGLFALLGGVFTMFGGSKNKSKKIKEIKGKVKVSEKIVKKKKEENKAIRETVENKKKVIEEMKKQKENFKPKDVAAKDAAKFLKNFAKKRKSKQ